MGKSIDFFKAVEKQIESNYNDTKRAILVKSSIETGLLPETLNTVASNAFGTQIMDELKIGETRSMHGAFGMDKAKRTGNNSIEFVFRDKRKTKK